MSKTYRTFPPSSWRTVRYGKVKDAKHGIILVADGKQSPSSDRLDLPIGAMREVKRQSSRARRRGWQVDLD